MRRGKLIAEVVSLIAIAAASASATGSPAADLDPLLDHLAMVGFIADGVIVVYPGAIVEIAAFSLPFRSRRRLGEGGSAVRRKPP